MYQKISEIISKTHEICVIGLAELEGSQVSTLDLGILQWGLATHRWHGGKGNVYFKNQSVSFRDLQGLDFI